MSFRRCTSVQQGNCEMFLWDFLPANKSLIWLLLPFCTHKKHIIKCFMLVFGYQFTQFNVVKCYSSTTYVLQLRLSLSPPMWENTNHWSLYHFRQTLEVKLTVSLTFTYSNSHFGNVSSCCRAGHSGCLHTYRYFCPVNTNQLRLHRCSKVAMIYPNLALIEESLVILGLTGGARVGHAQSDELADIPVLVSLQLGPGAREQCLKFSKDSQQKKEWHTPTMTWKDRKK